MPCSVGGRRRPAGTAGAVALRHELVAISGDRHERGPSALGSAPGRDRRCSARPRPTRPSSPIPYPAFARGPRRRAGAVARGPGAVAGVHARRGQRRPARPPAGPDLARTRSRPSGSSSFNLIHRNAILEMEPPDHTRLRRLISTAFARGHVERLRPWVEELAGRLVDGLVERSGGTRAGRRPAPGWPSSCRSTSSPSCSGVPEADRPLLRPWSNAIVKMYEYGRTTAVEDAAERAADEFVAYLRELAAERRAAPGRGPGLPPGAACATPRATG